MLRKCVNPFGKSLDGDQLLWHTDLKPHASGDFSIAVVQANSNLEDQSQVLTSPSATYVGVFDGHGGPEASRFVNGHLFRWIDKYATQEGRMSTNVIKKAFSATEEGFLRVVKNSIQIRPQIAQVGSCCLVGVISNGELYVANLGDSRVVLGKKVSDKGKTRVVAERLSSDHNVSLVEVRKEVEAQHPGDSHIVVYCHGGWRIKGIIQVSRSIGDFFLKKPEFNRDQFLMQYGNQVPLKRPALTAEPSIISRKLRPQDLFLIFASDGLWDHLTDEEAVDIVRIHPRRGIAKRLVGTALDKATKKRELRYNDIKKIEKGVRRRIHDDITVIVIYLDQQKKLANGTKLGCTSPPVDIFSCKDDKKTHLVQHT
ncbi:putative protein-serine/threonine phosphatase [Helianthus annuus]|uniref:protein-serine/threonine phosphatase n=1 Tax=Helianthus annuus TaxID=4232 RepID=A0A251V872_HELAN|nr:probable protein phosphatase 2C 63 [Helianthus annuus]KAF5814121.1 putative protein-serine/threonine phosphatase [Helianthus annuus]KAJ0592796.1 putative protein-serine/threonine phosphatase [Helianthus annuus]KAJ0600447.1 putative protein-serine/threonine phosphatase [Helianthus annuus]KAJ0607795.1 putative protein-serine/threonine phosphatase [Helianthus annuus]KAJ0767859.1 putative protein-serine/threonine phosphatase [Helianthus annuus]